MQKTAKNKLIAELRSRMAEHEAVHPRLAEEQRRPSAIPLGAAKIDEALPGGGITGGALHEVMATEYRDMGASIGFATALAVRCGQAFPDAPILWCEGRHAPFDIGHLYGPGLAAFGLNPARLILVSSATEIDLLWTMEEALRLGAFAAVIGEIDGRSNNLSLTATRRLQLAAEEGGRPALLLAGHASTGTSAAVTRWRVAHAPSRAEHIFVQPMQPIGCATWRLALERCRGQHISMAHGQDWIVEWNAMQRTFCHQSPHNHMAQTTTPLLQVG